MEPQFKDSDATRDGSTVEVHVRYEQGTYGSGKLDEKGALARAIKMIEHRLSDLETTA